MTLLNRDTGRNHTGPFRAFDTLAPERFVALGILTFVLTTPRLGSVKRVVGRCESQIGKEWLAVIPMLTNGIHQEICIAATGIEIVRQ